MKFFVWCCILLLPLVARAVPEEETEPVAKTDPVIVTVSAQELPLSATSASVTVLTREFIEANHAENIIELLQSVPFLHVSQSGARGGLSTVTLRGGDPNFVLVMMDGIPMNDPTNLLGGSYDLSNLSTEQIDRVEIVRGPFSALYGSEAISGVINIISRRGSGPPSFAGEAGIGKFSSSEIRGNTQGQIGKFDYSLGGAYFENGEEVEKDSFRLGTVGFQSRIDLGKGRLLDAGSRFHDSRASAFPENGGGPTYSILRETKETAAREFTLGIHYQQQWRDWWSFGLHFDRYARDSDSTTPAILDAVPPSERSLPSFQNETDFQRHRIQFENNWNRDAIAGSAGLEWKEENGDSAGLIADAFPSEFSLERTTRSVHGELLYNADPWNASLGIRMDDSDGFDPEWTPRAGLNYGMKKHGLKLKATWGEGFKLPSFFALGDPNIGNPGLRAEHSRGFDIGIEKELIPAVFSFSLTYYRNSFRDLIDFSPEEFRLVNRNLAITSGFELESTYIWKRNTRVTGHLNFLDAEIENSDEPLRDRPRWRGGFDLSGTTRPWQWSLGVLFVGDRFDFQVPVPERNIAESYSVVNASVSYALPHGMTPFVRIDNLLDNHYEEFVGFPNRGFYARFGLRFETGRR